MSINESVIDVIREFPAFGTQGGLQKPLALWPYGPVHLSGEEELLTILASRTGIIPARLNSFAVLATADKLRRVQAATGAKYWIVLGPWSDVYDEVERRGLRAVPGYPGLQFRCGDPRAWLDSHSAYIARLRTELARAAVVIGDAPVMFHVDYECWSSQDVLAGEMPADIARAIADRCWLIADILRGAFPSATQIWNDNAGVRDIGPRGYLSSIGYPDPKSMPGDVAHSGMFFADQPYFWESLFEDMDDLAQNLKPLVWNICLGTTARPSLRAVHPSPMRQNYVIANGNGAGYYPDYSHLLGQILGGHRSEHPRWSAAKRISLVEIESPLFDPTIDQHLVAQGFPRLADHVRAFLSGMVGR